MPMLPGPLLIDIPESFINDTATVSGANSLSQTITRAILPKFQQVIILSESSEERIRHTPWLQHPSLIVIHSLTELDKLDVPPTLAFSTSMDISMMVQARNFFQLDFPVLGLIHSLGTPTTFSKLNNALKHMTPNDGFICPSQATRTTLMNWISQHCPHVDIQAYVIPHGIDQEKFKAKPEEREWLRDYFRFNHDDIIFLHISRISPFTKTDMFPMIKTLTPLFQENSSLKLWIVGENKVPHYISMMQKYIRSVQLENQIMFDTTPDPTRMERYYQTADAFIYLCDNKAETFGLTIAEAASSDLPVITTDVCGASELISHERDGYIIPTISGNILLDQPANFGSQTEYGDRFIQSTAFSHNKFLSALANLANTELRTKMKERIKDSDRSRFSVDTMIKRYIDVFKERLSTFTASSYPNLGLSDIDSVLSHMTSDYLSSVTTLKITDIGKNVFYEKTPYYCMTSHLNVYLFIYSMLRYLDSHEMVTVKDIREQYSCHPEWIDATILYMIKNNLISWY